MIDRDAIDTLTRYCIDLRREAANVTLLGQLLYDERDRDTLRAAFAPLFRDGAADGLRLIDPRFDLPFALYLVLEGIYSYNQGDYWSGPRQALGLTDHYTAAAGELFRRALRRAGLPTFAHLGGLVHVTPILAHAGIPNYCLDDFFDLLDHAGRRGQVYDAPALLDEWAAGGFPANIDRPVQRFLLNGGPIAEDLVDRCLALWRETDDPESLDLPRRVLDSFERWRERRGPRRGGEAAAGLDRPKLTYDPFGEGVALVLPPLAFAADRFPAAVTWLIEAGGGRREEKTTRRPRADGYEFNPRAPINVLTVAPCYTVTALADGEPRQAWTLDGPDAPPLLAFDPITGDLLRDRRREQKDEYWFSPGERWLVYPRGWEAAAEKAHKLVELPDGDGDWGGYVFETWLLEPEGQLALTAPDGRCVAFRAHDDAPPARPTLVGRPLIEAGIHERFALYGGGPPLLCIPPGRGDHQPRRWHIAIVPADAADPPTQRAFTLDALRHRLVAVDDALVLPLDAPELLGAAPFGEFHVRLRGPYGRRAEFGLRFAPGLRFEAYPRLHLTTGDGPTAFRIIHADDLELASDSSEVALGPPRAAGPGSVGRDLAAAPGLTRVPLRLRGERGALAFDLPVYRLRFGLVEPEQSEAFHSTTIPLRLHPEALDTPHAALLRADLPAPPGATPPAPGWRLVDPDGNVLQEQPPDWYRPSRHPQTRLAEWLDTFRHAGRVAALQLVVADDATRQETAITIAHLLPTLELGATMASWRRGADGGAHLYVAWETAATARRRELRLWPVDRPWVAAPVVLAVPDDAADCAEWAPAPGRLPPGDYLAEMFVADPWAAGAPARPAPGGPNTFILRPDDMAAALDEARERAARAELPAEEALGWLIYLVRVGGPFYVARFNIILWRERATLSLEQLLLWADAVRAMADKTVPIAKALFDDERIAVLSDLDTGRRWAYLNHLSTGLPLTVYRQLLPLARGAPRRLCLEQLIHAADEAGYRAMLDEISRGTMVMEDAIDLLLPAARPAADFLFAEGGIAIDLLCALLRRAYDSRFIEVGSDLQTNVGYIRVTGIRNLQTQTHLKVCRHEGGPYKVLGKLWPATSRIPICIDLQDRNVHFLSSPVYKCQLTGCDYVYGNVEELNKHYTAKKGHSLLMPYLSGKTMNLTLPLTRLHVMPPE